MERSALVVTTTISPSPSQKKKELIKQQRQQYKTLPPLPRRDPSWWSRSWNDWQTTVFDRCILPCAEGCFFDQSDITIGGTVSNFSPDRDNTIPCARRKNSRGAGPCPANVYHNFKFKRKVMKKKITHTSALNNRSSSVCSVINWEVSKDKDKEKVIIKKCGSPRKKTQKKIIYKYIDLHMPVTRKGVGGANAPAWDFRALRRRRREKKRRRRVIHGVREPRRKTSSRSQSGSG